MAKGGFFGKILKVNLSESKVTTSPLPDDFIRDYLGGRGIGGRILYGENPPRVDPYSPDNRFILFTSPAMGTIAPCCVKYSLVTKSPLSDTILMSLAGGFFGPTLKRTGYDGLVIWGNAPKPVYLQILDQKVEILDAQHLWGKDTIETQEILQSSMGRETKIACIGPGGENLVRFASIFSESHTLGRGGGGAIMGSKNLKAIAVQGTQRVPLAEEGAFEKYIREVVNLKFKKSEKAKAFGKYGTPGVLAIVNTQGMLPTRNYQQGVFEGATTIDGQAVKEASIRHESCFRCPVACRAYTRVESGEYAGSESEGPEYETLFALGSNLGNANLASIIAANKLCTRYGVDTISTGNVIGFVMECFEKGILSLKDTEGMELKFGNHQVLLPLIEKVSFRKGIGGILAEGAKRAAIRLGHGAKNYAMEVKGLEMSGYDPRGAMGMAIEYATAPRGGCHQRGLIVQETFGAPPYVDRFNTKGKGALVKSQQDEVAIQDALGFCVFVSRGDPMGIPEFAEMFSLATGIPATVADLLKAGERIFSIERLYNLREGFTGKDDYLPKRFLEQPLTDGPSKGRVVDLEKLLRDYYQQRGWNEEGEIKPEKLEELGLKDLATVKG
ncbi:MAG: aldehyde ferredoxin oxidoreductase family protein [Thermodesulfobacteriota bacterium]|nr:aldehyde ferredoxin oxidoreductase family protein [Thermodesulfobacteriota bacterium]